MRPLGISIVAQTSYVSALAAAINLGSSENESYWATSDTKLLLEYLKLVKTCLQDNLLLLGQRIRERPGEIRHAAQHCIRHAKNEDAAMKLSYMLQTAAPDIQDQLSYLLDKIVDKLVLSRAGTQPAKMLNDDDMETIWLSELGLKVQE